MHRRVFIGSTLALAITRGTNAQSPDTTRRIGWLTAQQASSLAPFIAAFRTSLAELGYREGGNLSIEYRYGDDDVTRIPDLAGDLIKLPVSLIVVQGAAVPVVASMRLPVPVVYVFSGDPVLAGFADSLSRPRGNMTGLTFMAAELNGKRLELLREMVASLRRVAIIANPEHPGEQLEHTYSDEAARRLGIALDYYPTPTRDALLRAFASMSNKPPQAISVFSDGFAIQYRKDIIDFATSHRIPVISGWPVFAQAGALCTYGPRLTDSYRRLANYVDRVLKGAKPADLPIEQPTTFQFVINNKAAKTLGITIPPALLARADDVIE